jgi:hypothetical protein
VDEISENSREILQIFLNFFDISQNRFCESFLFTRRHTHTHTHVHTHTNNFLTNLAYTQCFVLVSCETGKRFISDSEEEILVPSILCIIRILLKFKFGVIRCEKQHDQRDRFIHVIVPNAKRDDLENRES